MTYVSYFLKDERLIILASSLKSCINNSFTNGKCKALMHDLVNAVRLYGLCVFHNSQLSV